MKVCLISSFFHPVKGGVENQMYYIAKHLINQGHKVDIFVSDRTRDGKINKKFEIIEGINVYRFKSWFKFSFSGIFFPGLYRAVKKSDADLFHIHGYRHPFNFACYFTKKPCLMTLHWPNYPKGIRSKIVEFLIPLFDKTIGRLLLKKFKKLLAVSGEEVDWIKNLGVNEKNIEITPNGIPKEYLKKRDGNKFREKLGISKDKIMVLCLSRIHKSKGFDQIVKIAKYFPDVCFVFAGIDGGFKRELIEMSKDLKNIIFLGELSEEEKLEAYNGCNIFIHPSRYEAFGIVILEAFSQGACVLSSNRGGLPWVVGDSGLTFECDNLEDLKLKLYTLIKDKKLRQKLSKKGLERVKNFTWEKITKNVEKIYESVL